MRCTYLAASAAALAFTAAVIPAHAQEGHAAHAPQRAWSSNVVTPQ